VRLQGHHQQQTCLDDPPLSLPAGPTSHLRHPRGEHGSLPTEWLLAEWPKGAPAPTDYWLSTLLETMPREELVRIAKIRHHIEHDHRELKTGLGLAHFEECTCHGWHHHVTLVIAAHLFIITLRLTGPKALGQSESVRHPPRASTARRCTSRIPRHCQQQTPILAGPGSTGQVGVLTAS